MDNTTTVQEIYAAFGRGDVPAILAHLDDRVAWDQWADNSAQKAGVPWLAAMNGPAEVVSFFELVGKFKFHDFRVLSVMAGGNQVAAEIAVDIELPSGARFRDEEMHLWTFDEQGQVTRFRHYLDTHEVIQAAGVA
jgi:ketosteroid isomerase-like protein